jgi:hypothetical protein
LGNIMRKFKILAALIAVLTVPVSANATLALKISDGTTTITVEDGGSGDANSAVGAVTYIGAIGNWYSNVSTGIVGGTNPSFVIDFNSINTSSSAGALTLQFSETGLTLGGYGSIPMSGGIGGTTTGTVSYALYADATNALFGHQQTVFSGGSLSGTPSFSQDNSGSADLTGSFSLTQWVQIAHTGAGSTSFDFQVDPIPEPGTLALLSLGLLGAGIVSRRRKTN